EIPTYVAYRTGKGGLFAGAACPIFESQVHGSDRIALSYPVNVRYAAGEAHVSEKEFLGAYGNVGSVCRKPLEFVRSVRGFVWPTSEVADWGEVWAVQDYFEAALSRITDNLLGDRMSLNGR